MEKPRKILKSPSVKRRNRTVPVNQRVTLERVIGLTASSNATLACDANTGTVAYPAGCVVVLFNPRRTKQSHILNFSKKTLTAVAFSPDGKHIVTGESGHQPAVRVWNVDDKSQVSELHGHKFGINCVAFSPNLKYLVSIGSQHDMMVNVWNWKTGTKVASNKISSKVNAVAFSEDGSMFVTVGNRHVKFWYLDSSKSRVNETVPLLGRSGILSEQKNNYFCDVACGKGSTSKCVFTITQSGLLCQFNEKRLLDKWVELRANTASCLSVGEDNIFIGCANGVVRVFSAQTLFYTTTLPHPHYLGVDVASALSPSQMICNKEDAKYPDTVALVFDDIHKKVTCIYNDHSLYMWDVHDVKKVGKAWSFLYHSSCVWGLEVAPPVQEGQTAVLPPGSFITCSSDDTIRIWNVDPHMEPTASFKRNVFSNELLKIVYIDPTFASLRDVNYNPAGGTDKTDTNYDGKNGVRSVCISPDGDHLASGDRIGNVRIHDLESMKELHTIEAHDGEVLCLEYSHVETGPKLLSSTSRDRLVHVFDVEQKYGLLQTLDDHSSSITAVKFTDNDRQLKMLSCGADKSLLFRSAQMSPEFQFSLSQHLVGKTTLYDMDIDPTQKFVATACQDRNIRIYNIKTAKQKKSYKGSAGDDGTLIRLKLDPSGSYIATTCTDKNLCVLDFCSGELVASSYGHSELSTGVKFTNDLKHLISVSGDGCIFIWRLSGEMTRQMQSRLEELGQLPVEAQSSEVMDKTLTLESLIPNDKEFKSPRKVLEELTKENEMRFNSPEKSQDYRFSVGQLPKWAKSKVGDDKSKSSSPDDQGASLPKGRWAQRVDNKKLLAQLDNKSLQSDIGSDRNTRKFNIEPSDETDGDNRRDTMVLSKPENTPRKIPVIFDDETNGDDDDEDFFPSFHKKVDDDSIWDESYKSPPFNQDSRNSMSTKRLSFTFTRNNSQDDLDELDSDTPEVIYYPPSEADSTETNGTSFTVFAGNNNDKSKKSLPRPSGLERSLDGDSESTDPVSLEDMDDDDDSLSIPSNPATPSDEMVLKTPDREKFLKDTFENLNFSPVPIENFEKKLDDIEKQANSDMMTSQTGDLFNSRLSISSRFLSRAQQANMRTAYGGIQRQDNWFDSVQKRKDAMARAVDETRKRLLAMGWKDQSPEPDQPEKDSVPSKLKPDDEDTGITLDDIKEQNTPTNKASSTTSSSSQSLPQRNVWDTRSESSDDSFHKTPTNKAEGTMPVPPPRGRRSRPVTLTLGEKKKDGTEQGGRTTPTMPKLSGRSQSHSSMHRKQTESSKAKMMKATSSSNIAKDNKTEMPKTFPKSTSMQNLSNNKMSLPKSKLKATKLSSLYTSTPDLAAAFQNDAEETESSNLQFSGRLSGSVPDLLDSDSEKSAKKSEKNKSSNCKVSSDTKRFSTGTTVAGKKMAKGESKVNSSLRSQRLSLPTGGASVSIDRDKKSRVRKSDVDLMPPPSSVSVAKTKADSSKQDEFIKKAMQSKRKPPQSASEMTLDMAKNILRGKSGILESDESSSDSSNVASVSSAETDRHTRTLTVTTTSSFSSRTPTFTSTFPVYTMASTTSVVYTTSCTVNSSTLSSSSSKSTTTTTSSAGPFLHEDANLLKTAAEIESTAAEIRHKSALEAAFQNLTVLDASPNDLPERDMAPSQLVPSGEDSGISQTSTAKGYYMDDSKISSDWSIGKASQSSQSSGVEVDEDGDLPPSASIKDRIALLTSHASPHQPYQGTNTTRMSSTASSPYLSTTPTRISKYEVSPSVSVAGLSPRSSSGIGSSLDSEAATKLFTSPGSSLSPQSNYDLTNTETHNVSDSDDTATKYSPRGFTSELEFTSNRNITVADALEAVSSGSQSSTSHPSTPPLPSSDPPTSQPLSSRSTPSSVISNKSTMIGSPRSNVTASPRSNVTGSPRSDLNKSPVVTNGYHSSPCKQVNLQTCMEAIKDLRQSIKKVTDLYDQVQHGDDDSGDAKNLLEDCFTEFSRTFSELVSTSSGKQSSASQNSEGLITLENFKHILTHNNEVLCDRFVQILNTKK